VVTQWISNLSFLTPDLTHFFLTVILHPTLHLIPLGSVDYKEADIHLGRRPLWRLGLTNQKNIVKTSSRRISY
jgi:hypothetical protein